MVLHQARLVPVRRLTPEECDLVGFEGPLVLNERQLRFLIGPWRRTGTYVVTHPRRGELLTCNRRELRDLGVDP